MGRFSLPLLLLLLHGLTVSSTGRGVSCGPVHWTSPLPRATPGELAPRDAPLRFASAFASSHAAALRRAADWLETHSLQVDSALLVHAQANGTLHRHQQHSQLQQYTTPLVLVAWWDPSLAPLDTGAVVAYTLSDNLWASWALRQLAPATSARIKASLCVLPLLADGLVSGHDERVLVADCTSVPVS